MNLFVLSYFIILTIGFDRLNVRLKINLSENSANKLPDIFPWVVIQKSLIFSFPKIKIKVFDLPLLRLCRNHPL